VSLDDLLAVLREFLNPDLSRLGLDRCLRRHGVGNLRDLLVKTVRPKHSGFKPYEPGYIHIDLKYLPHLLGECAIHLPVSEPMAWSKGSTDASRMCCKAIISDQVRNLKPRCSAMLGSTTSSSHNQH